MFADDCNLFLSHQNINALAVGYILDKDRQWKIQQQKIYANQSCSGTFYVSSTNLWNKKFKKRSFHWATCDRQ